MYNKLKFPSEMDDIKYFILIRNETAKVNVCINSKLSILFVEMLFYDCIQTLKLLVLYIIS